MAKYSKVHIEISNICNLQCSFCPEVVRAKKLMDIPLFQKIIGQVAPLAEQVSFHLMGDPLVHPELKKFVEICHENRVPISFVTNGVLLRETQSELLLHSALRQVSFSLHSFFDNYPDRDPSLYLDRIFAFTEKAFFERPDLYLNYRLWNLKHKTSDQMQSKNLLLLKKIEERFEVSVQEKLKNIDVRFQKSMRLKNKLYLHFDTEFKWPDLSLPELGSRGTCYGLSSHFGILVDGTVVPCCLDKEGSIPLGNVKDQTLIEILSNERSQKILAGFKKATLEEDLCKRCQYIERFQNKANVLVASNQENQQ